ncbi:MAG: hypothetical protein U0354_17805 [Candidatus Sericytochromatia bacterium]
MSQLIFTPEEKEISKAKKEKLKSQKVIREVVQKAVKIIRIKMKF